MSLLFTVWDDHHPILASPHLCYSHNYSFPTYLNVYCQIYSLVEYWILMHIHSYNSFLICFGQMCLFFQIYHPFPKYYCPWQIYRFYQTCLFLRICFFWKHNFVLSTRRCHSHHHALVGCHGNHHWNSHRQRRGDESVYQSVSWWVLQLVSRLLHIII